MKKTNECGKKKRKCNGNCPGCPNRGNCTGNCKDCPLDCPNKLLFKKKEKCCPITGQTGCPMSSMCSSLSETCQKGSIFGLVLFAFTALSFFVSDSGFIQGLLCGISLIFILYTLHSHVACNGGTCPVTGKCGSGMKKCPVSGKCGKIKDCPSMKKCCGGVKKCPVSGVEGKIEDCPSMKKCCGEKKKCCGKK